MTHPTAHIIERLSKLEKELIPAIRAEMDKQRYGSDAYMVKFHKYKNYLMEHYRLEDEHRRRTIFDVWAGRLHD